MYSYRLLSSGAFLVGTRGDRVGESPMVINLRPRVCLDSQESPYSWSILGVLVLATALVVVGLRSRASALSRSSNPCKMTFSRPMYVPLAVPGYPAVAGEVGNDTPSGYGYRLIRYLDRKLPEEERADPSKPTGFPILFVPGHVGSYEQASEHVKCSCDWLDWCE